MPHFFKQRKKNAEKNRKYAGVVEERRGIGNEIYILLLKYLPYSF